MNREELKKIIPHREPMLLVDEAYVGEDGKAYGKYTVTGEEWFVSGHFPGNPIVPGVIQCEMAAQACCVLFAENIKGKTPLFTGMNKVKFKAQVRPGDTINFICELQRSKPPFYFTSVGGYVNEKLCVSGEFSFTVI